jgi:hypothetical protein
MAEIEQEEEVYLRMLAELREARAADRPKSLGPRYAIVPRPAATVCGESPSASLRLYGRRLIWSAVDGDSRINVQGRQRVD